MCFVHVDNGDWELKEPFGTLGGFLTGPWHPTVSFKQIIIQLQLGSEYERLTKYASGNRIRIKTLQSAERPYKNMRV